MTTDELIQSAIDRLHQKGSGDWQSLMRQVDAKPKRITYNLAQKMSLMIADHCPSVNNLDLEWGRGTGKTTVLAALARRIVRDMPRGAYQWEVPTYQKFLTEIIPAFIHGLEMQGLYKDLHYFIGRRPPARWGWPEPYKPPARYDNFIFFWNGFGINLISQDVAGAGRGLSTDGRIVSEAVMLNPRKLDEESGPSLRGSNVRELGNRRFFDFRVMESSTPLTPSGAWFVERANLAIESPHLHRFIRANCVENIKLGWLKPNYLDEGRRTTADQTTFEAEYLNIRPNLSQGGFYYLLSEQRHTYTAFEYERKYTPDAIGVRPDCTGDADCDPNEPLIIGMDFGAAINCIVVAQRKGDEFRVLKNFFVKAAEGMTQDDVCAQFCDYYAPHPNKTLMIFHDASGNAGTGNTKVSRGVQAQQFFAARGWRAQRFSLGGTNPLHTEKYRLWEKILDEKIPHLPRFRINRANAKETFVSMNRAQVRQSPSGIKKWKGQERHDNPSRELATDLSDALDYAVYNLFNQLSKYGEATL